MFRNIRYVFVRLLPGLIIGSIISLFLPDQIE